MPLMKCPNCEKVQWNIILSMKCSSCGSPTTLVLSSHQEKILRDTEYTPTKEVVKQQNRQLFYCQNPEQSGDTTGVGVALLLFPERSLLFDISANEVAKAEGYLSFYHGLGIPPSRIVLAIGDVSADERSTEANVVRTLDSEEQKFSNKIIASSLATDNNRREQIEKSGGAKFAMGLYQPLKEKKIFDYEPEDPLGKLAQQRYDELNKMNLLSAKRKGQAASLVEKRIVETHKLTDNRKKRILDAFTLAEKLLSKMVGTVIVWEHLIQRGGNQMYQRIYSTRLFAFQKGRQKHCTTKLSSTRPQINIQISGKRRETLPNLHPIRESVPLYR